MASHTVISKTLIASLALLTSLWIASASALEPPTGPVVLTLSGNVTGNVGRIAQLDAAQLDALPQVEIATKTPWTDGATRFRGPLLRDVLTLVDARGTVLEAFAINDYRVEIPMSDAQAYRVILATHQGGKRLTVRTKGPLWVIYPWNENPRLQSETYYRRSIWQLKALNVR